MKKYTIRSLLTRTDEITEQRIAKQFPLTTDMETVFQRSLAKLGEDAEPANRSVSKKQLTMIRYLSAAACLILTIGLSVGVWAKRQKIEPLPPQETQTTTVAQTETKAETTAQFTTGSQTTAKHTETTHKSTETAVTPSEVTASQTAAVQATAMTTLAQTTTEQILTLTEPVTTILPTVPTYEGHYETFPPTESAQPSEIVTSTVQTTKPLSTRETVIMTSPDPLPGFQISEPDPNNCLEITFKTPVNPSPKQEVKYALQMDTYQAQEFYSGSESETAFTYKVTIGDEREVTSISIHVQPRIDFTIRCLAGDTLLPTDVSGFPGVYVLTKESCFLYWDDGLYTIEVSGPLEERDTILEIARHFKPCEIEETETKSTEPNS